MSLARLRLALVGETMRFPHARPPSLSWRWGNLPVAAFGASSSPRTKTGSFAAAFVLGFEAPPHPLHRLIGR